MTERFLDSVVAVEAEVFNAAGGANGGVAEVDTVMAAENILEHAIEGSGYGQLSDESSKRNITFTRSFESPRHNRCRSYYWFYLFTL